MGWGGSGAGWSSSSTRPVPQPACCHHHSLSRCRLRCKLLPPSWPSSASHLAPNPSPPPSAGKLQDVPSQDPSTAFPSRPVVDSYPVEERGGFVWLFFGSKSLPKDERPPIPIVPELEDPNWRAVYGEQGCCLRRCVHVWDGWDACSTDVIRRARQVTRRQLAAASWAPLRSHTLRMRMRACLPDLLLLPAPLPSPPLHRRDGV